jgi:hypothetical protein
VPREHSFKTLVETVEIGGKTYTVSNKHPIVPAEEHAKRRRAMEIRLHKIFADHLRDMRAGGSGDRQNNISS